jgi:hypothetical protein
MPGKMVRTHLVLATNGRHLGARNDLGELAALGARRTWADLRRKARA